MFSLTYKIRVICLGPLDGFESTKRNIQEQIETHMKGAEFENS